MLKYEHAAMKKYNNPTDKQNNNKLKMPFFVFFIFFPPKYKKIKIIKIKLKHWNHHISIIAYCNNIITKKYVIVNIFNNYY